MSVSYCSFLLLYGVPTQSPRVLIPVKTVALAPTGLIATTLPTSTSTTSAIASTAIGTIGEEVNRLVKAMEEISIQTNEINKLKEKVSSLEIDYKLSHIMHKEE